MTLQNTAIENADIAQMDLYPHFYQLQSHFKNAAIVYRPIFFVVLLPPHLKFRRGYWYITSIWDMLDTTHI